MKLHDLFEAIPSSSVVYHATDLSNAKSILASNTLRADTDQLVSLVYPEKRNQVSDEDTVLGVSTTRDKKFADDWADVVFVLDYNKLKQNYKIKQVDYGSEGLDEKEEFVIGSIKNLDRYIVGIYFPTRDNIANDYTDWNYVQDNLEHLPEYFESWKAVIEHPKFQGRPLQNMPTNKAVNEWGRIIKGVNTTKDINVDSIPQQAAKFGNKVNKNGYPPVSTTGKISTKVPKDQNLSAMDKKASFGRINEYNLNSNQQRWPLDNKATILVEMDPSLFLSLTTDKDSLDFIQRNKQSKKFYQDLMDDSQILVHPFIDVREKDGKVIGHEGRNRAAAALIEGDTTYTVAIILQPSSRQLSIKDIPDVWKGQFSDFTLNFKEAVSSGKIKVINDNVQRQYQRVGESEEVIDEASTEGDTNVLKTSKEALDKLNNFMKLRKEDDPSLHSNGSKGFIVYGGHIGYEDLAIWFAPASKGSLGGFTETKTRAPSLYNKGYKYLIIIYSLTPELEQKWFAVDGERLYNDLLSWYKYQETFIHEFVHYLDKKRFKNADAMRPHGKTSSKEYFNSPHEFNAFFQQGLKSFIDLNYDKFAGGDMGAIKAFQRFYPNPAKYIKDALLGEWEQSFIDSMDEKYKKKFLKRLANVWRDFVFGGDLEKFQGISKYEMEKALTNIALKDAA